MEESTGVDWLDELIDEYPTKRTDRAIERLGRLFKEIPQRIMEVAVDKYLLEQSFFPKVGDLAKYVQWAKRIRPYEIASQVADEELLRWEQERGTMPADEILVTDYLEWDEVPG